jgi:hypothetical protein
MLYGLVTGRRKNGKRANKAAMPSVFYGIVTVRRKSELLLCSIRGFLTRASDAGIPAAIFSSVVIDHTPIGCRSLLM